jgi:hypothetical protein
VFVFSFICGLSLISTLEVLYGVMDLKFVPASMVTSVETGSAEKMCISFSSRNLCPLLNPLITGDEPSEDHTLDASYNLGIDYGAELLAAVQDFCTASYSHVKSTLQPATHDVKWESYGNTSSFVHLSKISAICDYTHNLALYDLDPAATSTPPPLS